MMATVCRKAHFNAAHRLHNPKWTKEQNQKLFGKCNNLNYHGHNYNLIVKVAGKIDEETGYVADIKMLKDIINKNIIDRFDHRNLNMDVDDFKELNPTVENIAVVIWRILRTKINPTLKLKVVLYETERNFVEYEGE